MHEVCLGFSTGIGSSGETELLSDKWVGSIYRRALGDALIRLRGIVNSRMDKLYEECDIEKLPRMKASEKDQRQPAPWRKAFSKDGSYLVWISRGLTLSRR